MSYLSEFTGEQIDAAIRLILSGAAVPPGGMNGQALVKASTKDYDTKWKTVGGSGGGLEVLERDDPRLDKIVGYIKIINGGGVDVGIGVA